MGCYSYPISWADCFPYNLPLGLLSFWFSSYSQILEPSRLHQKWREANDRVGLLKNTACICGIDSSENLQLRILFKELQQKDVYLRTRLMGFLWQLRPHLTASPNMVWMGHLARSLLVLTVLESVSPFRWNLRFHLLTSAESRLRSFLDDTHATCPWALESC